MEQEDRIYPALANDDAHALESENHDTYQGWTMVRVKERSATAVPPRSPAAPPIPPTAPRFTISACAGSTARETSASWWKHGEIVGGPPCLRRLQPGRRGVLRRRTHVRECNLYLASQFPLGSLRGPRPGRDESLVESVRPYRVGAELTYSPERISMEPERRLNVEGAFNVRDLGGTRLARVAAPSGAGFSGRTAWTR